MNGKRLQLGNTTLMEEAGLDTSPLRDRAEQLRLEGMSIMYLAVDGVLAGLLAVSDPVKPTSKEAVTRLQAEDVKVIMATGDGLTTARAVAKQLGIEFYGAREVQPSASEGGIAFFPDGASTGGRVQLSLRDAAWNVDVAWLTGEVTLHRGEVVR